MSAPTTLNTTVVADSSKNTSFDSRRSSQTSNEGQQKPANAFKRMGRAIKQHAIEHHRSVQAAHKAVYGV